MKLAISGQALSHTYSLEEVLALFNKLEVRWIELWPLNLEGGKDPTDKESRYEGKNLEKTKDLLASYGIGVACVTMPGAFFSDMASDSDDYIVAFRKTIDVAVELEAKIVNCYCYYFALGRDAGIEPFVKVMRKAASYAADRGVTLVLENEAHDATATVDGMLRILTAVNSEAMKTNFDPCNYYQATEEAFPYGYHRLKDHIGYIHLKNGQLYDPQIHPEYRRKGAITGRPEGLNIYYPPLPEGAVNMEAFLAQIRKDRYKDFCTLEPHVPKEELEEYYRVEVTYARRHGVE